MKGYGENFILRATKAGREYERSCRNKKIKKKGLCSSNKLKQNIYKIYSLDLFYDNVLENPCEKERKRGRGDISTVIIFAVNCIVEQRLRVHHLR